MAYGITTSRAHLNTLGAAPLQGTEIDWSAIIDWKNSGVSEPAQQSPPLFAGRYFLGRPDQTEIDSDTGFCLWAHGEGVEPLAPDRVVPLQRASPERQEAVGSLGEKYGLEDAQGIGTYLQYCLTVGDLELPPAPNFVLVFLEVAAGTRLSFDYWFAWATTLEAQLMAPVGIAQLPLRAAIACEFVQEGSQSVYMPESPIQDCLNQPPPAGRNYRCAGFWVTTTIANPTYGEFFQATDNDPVPICYQRYFSGPAGDALPQDSTAALHPTLNLMTVDESVAADADPTAMTMRTTGWSARNRPTQTGVDKNRSLASRANCLRSRAIAVHRLPAGIEGGDDLGVNFDHDPITVPTSVVFRYYSAEDGVTPEAKDIRRDEVLALTAAGLLVGVTWQARTTSYLGIRDHFESPGQGLIDAENAFRYATETIRQPPYTPIYFAVDFPPGKEYGDRATGDFGLMPSLEQVIEYFRDVRRAAHTYMHDHPERPYYIGMYASHNVCAAGYREGLASHFWQPWPPSWGPDFGQPESSWDPFPHLNAWQVLLENGVSSLWDHNTIQTCMASNDRPGLDLNVHWGDPGGWQLWES